jgi:anti-sigma factor RsiW
MTIPGETITCREIVEIMTEYLEGTLSDTDRVVFERHIAQCPPCRDYLAQLRVTIEEVGKLKPFVEEEIPEATREALLHAFRGFRRSPGEGGPTS